MPHYRPTPPQLATLHTKPTWHNRAGRADRSACLELRASELWRYATFPTLRLPGYTNRLSRFAAPDAHPPTTQHEHAGGGAASTDASQAHDSDRRRSSRPRCIATAAQVVTPRFLRRLHDYRLPMQLVGDHRTRKSNVMKSHYRNEPGQRAANPNRGALQLKWLALPIDDWTQTITIQRWFFPLPPRFDPYLNCMQPRHRLQHFLLCPRCKTKVCKLFMPLCTHDELRDAITAQQYATLLQTHPLTRNAPITPLDAAIISRYRALFHPRSLLCRTCLHLRYGESKARA